MSKSRDVLRAYMKLRVPKSHHDPDIVLENKGRTAQEWAVRPTLSSRCDCLRLSGFGPGFASSPFCPGPCPDRPRHLRSCRPGAGLCPVLRRNHHRNRRFASVPEASSAAPRLPPALARAILHPSPWHRQAAAGAGRAAPPHPVCAGYTSTSTCLRSMIRQPQAGDRDRPGQTAGQTGAPEREQVESFSREPSITWFFNGNIRPPLRQVSRIPVSVIGSDSKMSWPRIRLPRTSLFCRMSAP